MFSRRQFIIGSSASAAGLVLPSFAAKAVMHFEATGIPLFEDATGKEKIIHAYLWGENYTLSLASAGYPELLPPPTTYREFFEFSDIEVTEDYLRDEWFITLDDLDKPADEFSVETQWEHSRSPTAQAFTTLQQYKDHLGPELLDDEEEGELGSISFNEFSHPGSDARWVEVSSPVGLSCLQHRLKALGTDIKIEVASDD